MESLLVIHKLSKYYSFYADDMTLFVRDAESINRLDIYFLDMLVYRG